MDRDEAIGVVRRIYEDGYNRGIESVFDECYTPDFRHHSKVIFDVPPAGEGEKQSMHRFRAADLRRLLRDPRDAGRRGQGGRRLNIQGTRRGSDGAIEPGQASSSHALILFRSKRMGKPRAAGLVHGGA